MIMKKTIVLNLLLLLTLSVSGQKIKEPYAFKITQKSPEWAKISTGAEMVSVCQIPDSIIKSLTTSALAQTCLNYPLFFQHTALNDERKAIKEMINEFNGLRELSLREDGLKELIKLYKGIPVIKEKYLQSNSDDVPYKTIYLELILSSDIFMDKASENDLNEIKEAFLNKYTKKLDHQDIHSLYSIRKTLLLGSVVYLKQNQFKTTRTTNTSKVNSFVNNFDTVNPNELTQISKIITQ